MRRRGLGRFLIVGLLAAGGAAAWFWVALTRPYQGFAKEGVFVNIPHGASRRAVARLLSRNGVVRSAVAFEIYARRHPKRTVVAGEYFFDHPVTGRDVFWTLASGNVYEQPFIVHEGETIFEIGRDLEAGRFLPASEFVKAASNPAPIHDLSPRAPTLEGFLFPATYHFPRRPEAQDVVNAMVQKFKEQWKRITLEAYVPDVAHVVTLASLVERETPQRNERPIVAGVFENRLSNEMALQCDPTVIYALERTGQYKGALTSADLRYDSPYNTYRKRGLPPGPIGNPGEASLRAALHPARTGYLYFVANTQGGHFFGKTLAEHNRNVARYRHLLKGERVEAAADPAPPHPARKRPRHKGKRS